MTEAKKLKESILHGYSTQEVQKSSHPQQLKPKPPFASLGTDTYIEVQLGALGIGAQLRNWTGGVLIQHHFCGSVRHTATSGFSLKTGQ